MMDLLRDRQADRPTDRQIDQKIYTPCYGFALVDLREHQKQCKNQVVKNHISNKKLRL